jgi:hypothetical protein
MAQLTTSRLTPKEISEAFALVQLASPTASFSHWRAYANGVLRNGGELRNGGQGARGFLVARDQHRIILGILHFEVRHYLQQGRLMRASNILTCGASARHRLSVILALIRGLEALAQREFCACLVTQVPQSADAEILKHLSTLLRASGHQRKNFGYLKQLS